MSGPRIRVRTRQEIARQRRPRRHQCWDHLIAAPLWPLHGANLGTLLRTCDAVGACLAVPRLPWVPEALARGNTLRRPACVHWTGRDACRWLLQQRAAVGDGVAAGRLRRLAASLVALMVIRDQPEHRCQPR